MLKAAIHLLAGRATAADTARKIMDDFERLMDSGDPQQSTEILKPEVRASRECARMLACTCSHRRS